MSRQLVILSVPIIRIGRVLLGAPVLETIKEKYDVLIISSSTMSSKFQSEFADSKTQFFKWESSDKSLFQGRLEVLSNILRVHGYWFRNRHKNMGLAYYNHNAVYQEQIDGTIKKYSWIKSLLYKLVARLGYFSFTWQWVDAINGLLFRKTNILDNVINNYETITLIQSSSWGEQDIYLAWLAKKLNIRSILIPYSTDQLYCNGFLLSQYEHVCVQGEFEKKCAILLHGLSEEKITKLGSAWFRNLDKIIESSMQESKSCLTRIKYILFSGHSSQYFSRASEYKVLAHIEKAVSEGLLGKVKIIYRPVATTQEEIKKIHEDWGAYENIEIQLPEMAVIGLQSYSEHRSLKQEWHDYVTGIQKADVLVMTFFSSLALDIAYLGKPVLAILDDQSGSLTQKNTTLLFDSAGKIPGLENIPIVYQLENLIPMIQQALLSTSDNLVKFVNSSWDCRGFDFRQTIHEMLEPCKDSTNVTKRIY